MSSKRTFTSAQLGISRTLVSKTVLTVVLLVFTFVVSVPFLWMLDMSLRTNSEILLNPLGLPTGLDMRNFIRLFVDPQVKFYRYIVNSAVVSAGALFITLALSSTAGYGFARRRYNFKLRGPVFGVLMFSLMLPPQVMYIPQYIMMSKYGLLDTRLGLILVYAAYAITMSTLLIRTYFTQLPEELEESARIDGATDYRVFFSIMLPLARPVLLTVTLFQFRYFWNELLLAMTFITSPGMRTLPLAMMNFVSDNASNYAMAAASLIVGMAPVLILYIVFAERFAQGMTAGAIKG